MVFSVFCHFPGLGKPWNWKLGSPLLLYYLPSHLLHIYYIVFDSSPYYSIKGLSGPFKAI
jgi:hypothetical protein